MKELRQYFDQNEDRLIDKWDHYFRVYERHLSRFRNQDIVVLEIGVFQGGSLQMWKHYFGDRAKIYGIDIDPRCKEFEEENIKIFVGSQSDRNFLREVKQKIPKLDILIDDGGHKMTQQIVTFEELFGHIKDDGVYLCEDLHTSYWIGYGGGYRRRGTFIEYSKNFIDKINAFHSEQKSLRVTDFTTSVDSLHYYDSILVIEKSKREEPFKIQTGVRTFPTTILFQNKGSYYKYKRYMLYTLNRLLRYFRLRGVKWR